MPGGRWISHPRMTASPGAGQRHSWASRHGPVEIWRPRTAPTPTVWRMCSGAGTSQERSGAPSRWQIYASRRVVSAMPCAPTSRRCSLRASRGRVVRGTANMYIGLSELQRERNELDAATQSLLTSQELGEHPGLPKTSIAGESPWRASAGARRP